MRPPGKSPLERAYATIAVTIAWITGLTHSATCCGTPRIKLTLRIHQLEAVSKAEPLDRPAFVPGTPRNSSFMLVFYQLATQKSLSYPHSALSHAFGRLLLTQRCFVVCFSALRQLSGPQMWS